MLHKEIIMIITEIQIKIKTQPLLINIIGQHLKTLLAYSLFCLFPLELKPALKIGEDIGNQIIDENINYNLDC